MVEKTDTITGKIVMDNGFSSDDVVVKQGEAPQTESTVETEEQKDVKTDSTDDTQNKGDIANSTSNKITLLVDDSDEPVEFDLDENGNAVKDGQVVYTKEQLDAAKASAGTEDDDKLDTENIHTSISSITGIDLLDENNNPIEFEDTISGLAEREVFVKDSYYRKGKEEAVRAFLNAEPELFKMYQYKQKHGTLKGYSETSSYREVNITDETSSDELKSIYREYLLSKDLDSDIVDTLITTSEKDETLRLKAIDGLQKLKAKEQAEIEEVDRIASERQAEFENQTKAYYGIEVDRQGRPIDLNIENSLYDKIVKKGEVGKMVIPKEGITIERDNKRVKIDRLTLFSYFYNPVKLNDGRIVTQAYLDEMRRLENTDEFIIQGITNLSGGNIKSLQDAFIAKYNVDKHKSIIRVSTSAKSKTKEELSQKDLNKKVKSGQLKVIF